MRWEPPGEFEEYRIVRSLGAGSMGVVFLAHDTLLDRPVAIKFVSALEVDTATRERFLTEARAVARLSHPNVVAIHRVGEVRQRPYLVSEYVRGISLAAVTKPVPWERALRIGIGLARGLGAAHRRGVLHRDIKPANVMLGENDDEAKLLDFGLAKLASRNHASPGDRDTPSTGETELTRPFRVFDAQATTSLTDSIGEADTGHPSVVVRPMRDTGLEHTREGTILGTPLYLAPELWRRAPASQASDVYALGIILYELVAGHVPHAGLEVRDLAARVQAEPIAPIATRVANVPTRFAEVIDACVSRDPSQRPGSGDVLCDLLEAVIERASSAPEGSPYRGLSAFEPEHRSMFFGRAAETRSIVERLRTETFVIVAGDSGAGKSSLCRAAVLPAIAEKSLGGKRWHVTTAVPGTRPLARIEAALAEPPNEDGLLLFIDQLEELVTIAEPAEAAEVAERLAELVVASSHVRVIATARSDFLGRLAALPGLGELVGRALFLLGPLRDRGLRDAIVGPARAAGYSFEAAATVDELVASGGRHLPLLQFALAELWDARDQARRVIPAEALATIGGVTGALARHADSVFAGLTSTERDAARTILLSLVSSEGTRAPRSHSELLELASRTSPRASSALDALVRGRLLVAQETASGEESAYTIAHEALLQGWDTLRGWLEQNVQGRVVRQRIERAAAAWDQLGRRDDALWNERLLKEAAGIDETALPSRESAFLRAGRSLARRRRTRRWAVGVGALVVVTGVILWLRIAAAHERGLIVAQARALRVIADVERNYLVELRRAAFARFDGRALAEGEAFWREAVVAEPSVDRDYARIEERLAQLLQEDPGHSDARALLSDTLYERARLAEESGRARDRDDVLGRLRVYGSGERWNAPARLAIATDPAGAAVTIRRYELSDGRWTASPARELGTTPTAEHELAPGSALLQLTLPGRAAVRMPLLVPRGDTLRLSIQLPLLADVPPGFAYVPAGRFLYGTADEHVRPFFASQPIHEVETGPYLIALNETTFGEWIEFLRALPEPERRSRTPNVLREDFTVALTELPDHTYQIALGRDEPPYQAREGEPIRHAGRTRHDVQDWSRLPVTAVSFDDMRAYTAWLHDSGRVPNARPCNEHEWERAARGADGRAFPHGDQLEPGEANHDLTYGRVAKAFGPDEVGSYPASDSPFGVHDLSGNVWEWTASHDDPSIPVARGGGFFQASFVARPENRSPDISDRRDAFYGVRVCASVPTR